MREVPSLCRHKSSGQFYVKLAGQRHYLGAEAGPARARYARLITEWEASGRSALFGIEASGSATVATLVAAFLEHASNYYKRSDGTAGSEVVNYGQAVKPLLRLYGDVEVREIDALKIEAVRDACIDHRWMTPADRKQQAKCHKSAGWCRRLINQHVGRWKRIFRWGFTRKLVSLEVLEQVRAVEGLRLGRSRARESVDVMPVPSAVVDATLPYLLAPVRAMVELQRLTGMRPGEACRLCPAGIDRTGDALRMLLKGTPIDLRGTWAYLPGHHKTEHRGHNRVILIGPRAQAVLAPFLDRDPEACCFSPAEALAAVRLERREKRKTPVQPSQQNRRVKRPQKAPASAYTPTAYAHSIAQACKRSGIPHWHPHQLRHLASHEIERNFDYETARQVLGHRHVNTTKLYLRAAIGRASEAMDKAG